MLSVMGCLVRPDSGSVRLLGQDVTRLDDRGLASWRRDRIGYVFQSARLLGTLTAIENVMLGLELAGWPRRRAREAAECAIDRVGLAAKANQRSDALSGGERQRVSIARAVAKSPPLVLVDEPTAALDRASGLAIAELLRRIADSATHTVVVVSHDDRLVSYADYVLGMTDGRVEASGPRGHLGNLPVPSGEGNWNGGQPVTRHPRVEPALQPASDEGVRRWITPLMSLAAVVAAAAITGCADAPARVSAAGVRASGPATVAAAPGRVEGCSDALEIGADTSGVLASVLVKEGDVVQAGSVIAEIECRDVRARLKTAEALAGAGAQTLLRVQRGVRSEERDAARAAEDEARAAWQQAAEHADRMRRLFEDDQVVAREAVDAARRESEAARARLDAAAARRLLAQSGPLPEELAVARLEADAASRRVAEVRADVEKCTVRAPATARVARVFRRAGESVSTVYPTPICLLADPSCTRVRAEADEGDLAKISVGQEVVVQAEALPAAGARGRVTQLLPVMGRRRVRSGDPAEKADRDVREVLVVLEGSVGDLPLGLRVTILFLAPR
jgi:putative ABC transport system ATP-binding protein